MLTGEEAPDDVVDCSAKAVAYAKQQVDKLGQAVVEARTTALATEQRRLYHIVLLRYGGALGTLASLRVTRLLPDVAYEQLRQEAQRWMMPHLTAPTPTS